MLVKSCPNNAERCPNTAKYCPNTAELFPKLRSCSDTPSYFKKILALSKRVKIFCGKTFYSSETQKLSKIKNKKIKSFKSVKIFSAKAIINFTMA